MLSTRSPATSEGPQGIDGSSPLVVRLHYLRGAHRVRLRTVLLNAAAAIAVTWIVVAVAIGLHS